ncbi:unnamed protein product [Hydatigera taeniaeformis]|uniref:Secreted protein n=1 Tax=Hydatigena taeniaeformis TaxID=6205 RepID=A0A158REY1_HYDTA|nr:unnamed protein product [Hydatigera taeniaeformis]
MIHFESKSSQKCFVAFFSCSVACLQFYALLLSFISVNTKIGEEKCTPNWHRSCQTLFGIMRINDFKGIANRNLAKRGSRESFIAKTYVGLCSTHH